MLSFRLWMPAFAGTTSDCLSFPGSAWERRAGGALPRSGIFAHTLRPPDLGGKTVVDSPMPVFSNEPKNIRR